MLGVRLFCGGLWKYDGWVRKVFLVLLWLVAGGFWEASARGWTPGSQEAIALDAARLAPPDLYRQLRRNRAAYLQGVGDPVRGEKPEYHVKNPNGSGRLDEVIGQSVENAVLAIQLHRPFNEVAYRLGLVSHYLADLNFPLNLADEDPEERRYFADFAHYLESVDPRLGVVFYGFRSRPSAEGWLSGLLGESLARGRELYPKVGLEYRRVSFARGSTAFDDRSTAFAVAALARSHAVSDIADMLRYIWLSAGGTDTRKQVPSRGGQVIQLRGPARVR